MSLLSAELLTITIFLGQESCKSCNERKANPIRRYSTVTEERGTKTISTKFQALQETVVDHLETAEGSQLADEVFRKLPTTSRRPPLQPPWRF